MKTLRWLVAPLAVAAIAIAAWLATPNALAAVWTQHYPAVKLIAANKSKAATAFHCTAPGVPVADVTRFTCTWKIPDPIDAVAQPRVLHCEGAGVATIGEDAYVLLLSQGRAGPYTSRAGGSVTVAATTGDMLASACLAEWQAFADAVWPGTWNTLLTWTCARNPALASQIDCEADNARSGTSTEYLDAGGGKEGGPALQGVVQ